jgi:23S rRNA (cytosine1962-C5)-methyltransferase
LGRVILKTDRDRAVRLRHPWIFSGAIKSVDDSAVDGAVVDVYASDGHWMARGHLNRKSQICIRLCTWDPEEALDKTFWRKRVTKAVSRRADLESEPSTTAYRLVNAESDGLPGLVVDRYGEWLALQALTLGADVTKGEIAGILWDTVPDVQGVFERSDVDVRLKEGLDLCKGPLVGSEPPERVEILENGHRFLVDIRDGHKTGFYLDQRENRQRFSGYCSGAEVLNAFSYTGAFGIYALSGNAQNVVDIDTSGAALAVARKIAELNGFNRAPIEYREADVFAELRSLRGEKRSFDIVVLDPPRFALSRSHVKKAARGYKDINWLAFQLLRPGGMLFTFSCSGLVSRELFRKIVFDAALDAGRDAQILGWLSQGSDHPSALNFPESEYLKGLMCRVS